MSDSAGQTPTALRPTAARTTLLTGAVICFTLGLITAILWWQGVTLMQDDIALTRAEHPSFSTPPPTTRVPWHSPHMALMIAAAAEHVPEDAPVLRPAVHTDDVDQLTARLRNTAATRGWYLATTQDRRTLYLATPSQGSPALREFEKDPVKWLQQPAPPPADTAARTTPPVISTHTVELQVNGNSPLLHRSGVTGVAMILTGCLALAVAVFVADQTAARYRANPNLAGWTAGSHTQSPNTNPVAPAPHSADLDQP